MAVSGQKRKAIGEPCTLRLETSGSSSAAFAEMQAYQKRRRFDQNSLSGTHDYQHDTQAQPFLSPPHGTVAYSTDGALHRSSSRNDGSSVSGYGNALDVGGSPQISTATACHRGWPNEYAPAGSFVSSDSHQQSSVGDQHEVAMQAETPHSQAQEASRDLSFYPQGLQRSNSEPNMRLMLALPLNTMPQQIIQQPFPTFGGSSTAGALVPYKAPEEVILDALRSTQMRAVHDYVSQLQASQAVETHEASAAHKSGVAEQGGEAMEVDQ